MPANSTAAREHASDGAPLGLLWGAQAIGQFIDRSPRQVYHIHRTRLLKSIRKVGDLLVADPSQLTREIRGEGS